MSDVSSSSTCASSISNLQSPPSPPVSRSSPKCKRRRLLSDLMGEGGSVTCGPDQSSSHGGVTSLDDVAVLDSKDGTSKFYVRSNNEGFKCRQSSVFDTLNALEAKHSSDIAEWKATDYDRRPADAEEEEDEENELPPRPVTLSPPLSVDIAHFKVPIGLPLKRLNKSDVAPADYTLHPEKWTKYTLADVNNDCMSENANSAAAIDFLSGKWKMGSDYDDDGGEEAADSSGGRMKHEYRTGRQPAFTSAASGCVSAAADSSSNDAELDGDEDVVGRTEPKITSKPLVQLSFLNCTKHCEDVYGKSADEDEGEMEKTIEPDGDLTPSNVASPFRSIRKRHRNLRPTASSSSNEDDEHN